MIAPNNEKLILFEFSTIFDTSYGTNDYSKFIHAYCKDRTRVAESLELSSAVGKIDDTKLDSVLGLGTLTHCSSSSNWVPSDSTGEEQQGNELPVLPDYVESPV